MLVATGISGLVREREERERGGEEMERCTCICPFIKIPGITYLHSSSKDLVKLFIFHLEW